MLFQLCLFVKMCLVMCLYTHVSLTPLDAQTIDLVTVKLCQYLGTRLVLDQAMWIVLLQFNTAVNKHAIKK